MIEDLNRNLLTYTYSAATNTIKTRRGEEKEHVLAGVEVCGEGG